MDSVPEQCSTKPFSHTICIAPVQPVKELCGLTSIVNITSIIYVRSKGRNCQTVRNKHFCSSHMPACDGEVQGKARKSKQRHFGSSLCGHVSVWWFSSLWRSVSWNDYAEGLGVNTMTHLLFSASSSSSSSRPHHSSLSPTPLRTGTLAKTTVYPSLIVLCTCELTFWFWITLRVKSFAISK